ncbi:hypothetical protein Btru_067549 [Bulinus truncatus]|nr:hypothetical protein Btru_067549 [Bulinus truncatus]
MADVISRNFTTPTPRMQKSKKSARKTPRRPVTPGKNRSGKDFWMAAIKKRQTLTMTNGYRPSTPKHMTTTEYFIDTLRRTGVGISSETNKNQSLTGLPRGGTTAYPYLSTSHYMRQAMGVENTPRALDNTLVRTNTGTPAYKTPEEYYDEVLALRKQIAALTLESSTNKTRIRRLEEDNQKKEKEIESLLNPEKNSELRRTIGDRRADSGAVLHSYKQKILKLETQLKSQEAAHSKLQSDLKTTKLDEMRVQLEVLYSELVRMQMLKDTTGQEKSSPAKETTAKVKALSETVIRLSKTNEQLQAENKSLKDDLNRLMEESESKLDVKKDYADMNRKELLRTIMSLEQKLNQAESGMLERDDGSVRSIGTPRKAQGKIDLKGPLEDRLQQLDDRETQLLQEISRLQSIVKRERDKKDEKNTSSLPPTPRKRQSLGNMVIANEEKIARPLSNSRPGSARRSETGSRPVSSRSREEKVENFKQKHAAASIQRHWKQRQQQKQDQEVQAFRENLAAKRIQHGWLDYKNRHYDEELDDAAHVIQGALKGHHTRHRYIDHSDDKEDHVYLIQSNLRGHRVRLHNLRNMKNLEKMDSDSLSLGRRSSPSSRPPTSQSKTSVGSRGSLALFGSQQMNTGRRASPNSRPSSASLSRRKSGQVFQAQYDLDDVDDDDDDIMT